MKRILSFLLALITLLLTCASPTAASDDSVPPITHSKCAWVYNVDNDTVLWSKNAEEKIYPASTVTLMTAALAIEYFGDNLSQTITDLLADGYEYASPTAGQNIQSVQMVDLDSDGDDEALAFFRNPADEKPLKIMLFRFRGDAYEPVTTIESSGTAIERVEYRDMNVDGVQELVVGWRIGPELQTVAVYTVSPQPAVLMQSNYTRYSIQEMDGDGVPSLMVLRADAEGDSVAEFYGWRTDAMTLVYSGALSSTMAAVNSGSLVTGMLDEDTAAVYVTGVNEEGRAMTDILACRDNGTLTNAALNSATGLSGVIHPYRQLQPQDINGDGYIEIPAPSELTEADKQNDGLVDWLQCSVDGEGRRVATTYHCLSSGWYLVIPEDWVGRVTTTELDSGFYESEVLLKLDGEGAAAVYTITGENRESRAVRGNRVVLRRQTDIVYAGEVLEGVKDFTSDDLRSGFKLIVASWTN